MRILYWTEQFWPQIGGVEVLSRQLLSALQKLNYHFWVVSSHSGMNFPDVDHINSIEVYRFHFQKVLANRDLKEIARIKYKVTALKQELNPDLIHINSSQPSIFFHYLTQTACAAPVVFTVHEPPPFFSKQNTLLEKVLRSADWVTAVSKAMLSQARDFIPDILRRSSVIYNGLEKPVFKPSLPSFDSPRLVCLGRIIENKGFDLAIKAYKIIARRFPKTQLVIAGDGPARAQLEQMANDLDFIHPVEFTGWITPEEIYGFLEMATIVIVPSRWSEPFGLVALQAAQMARPVVAARVGGLPEIIDHEKTGLLFEKNNINDLADAVCFMLQNPDLSITMGKAARQRVLRLFTLERMTREYDVLYQRLKTEVTGS